MLIRFKENLNHLQKQLPWDQKIFIAWLSVAAQPKQSHERYANLCIGFKTLVLAFRGSKRFAWDYLRSIIQSYPPTCQLRSLSQRHAHKKKIVVCFFHPLLTPQWWKEFLFLFVSQMFLFLKIYHVTQTSTLPLLTLLDWTPELRLVWIKT